MAGVTPPEREPIAMNDNVHGMFGTGTKLELVAEPDGSHRWVDDHTQPSLEGGRVEIRHTSRGGGVGGTLRRVMRRVGLSAHIPHREHHRTAEKVVVRNR